MYDKTVCTERRLCAQIHQQDVSRAGHRQYHTGVQLGLLEALERAEQRVLELDDRLSVLSRKARLPA
jgi:hypothetical protein